MLEDWEARKGKTTQNSQNVFYKESKRTNQKQKKNEKWKVNPNKIFLLKGIIAISCTTTVRIWGINFPN